MNAPFGDQRLTQAADGLPRRAFTVEDVTRLEALGFLDDMAGGYELIDGEIVPMSAEFNRHMQARMRLVRRFMAALAEEDYTIATEASLILSERVELKPDLHVFPAGLISHEVTGPELLLAVELASSSQRKDFRIKKPLYARHGVRELWILDLDSETGLVCTEPSPDGFGREVPVARDAVLTPGLLPAPSVRFGDLI